MAIKLKVLVIEDCDRDAELLRRKLEDRFDLEFVNTRKAGLDALQTNAYSVVIIDLTLTNGLKDKILDEVKELCGEAVTIILTGDTDPRTRDHMRHKKADNFVVKGKEDSQEDLEAIIFSAIALKASKLKKGKQH